MRCLSSVRATLALAAVMSAPVHAQQLVAPIRALDAAAATSAEEFLDITDVRATSQGVLVYDKVLRQLVFLDSGMRETSVLVDTAGRANRQHGRWGGRLIAYGDDSTLFADTETKVLHVLGPRGEFARVMALPAVSYINAVVTTDPPALDPQGRLLFRIGVRTGGAGFSVNAGSRASRDTGFAALLVVAVPVRGGNADTVTMFHVPTSRGTMFVAEDPPAYHLTSINPTLPRDAWTMLSDGSVAVVRGEDYHVDVYTPDGGEHSSRRIPFEWQRLTLARKEAIIDSMRQMRRAIEAEPGDIPAGDRSVAIRELARRSDLVREGRYDVRGPLLQFVEGRELRDYWPAFSSGGVRADREDRLWVQVHIAGVAGGPVYDVLSRDGERLDRVQLPSGRTLVGFGDGVLYAAAPARGTRVRLERYGY